jgi:hypothetical protein
MAGHQRTHAWRLPSPVLRYIISRKDGGRRDHFALGEEVLEQYE